MKTVAVALCMRAALLAAVTGGVAIRGSEAAFATRYGFSIVLTDQWCEIPTNVLASRAKKSGGVSSDSPVWWGCGYQLAANTGWFQSPHLLVRVRETGRMSDRKVKYRERMSAAMWRDVDSAEGMVGHFLRSSKQIISYADSTPHTQFGLMKQSQLGSDTAVAFLALRLTQRGYISLTGTMALADAAQYVPLFESAARRIRLSDELQYTYRLTESVAFPGGPVWGADTIRCNLSTGQVLSAHAEAACGGKRLTVSSMSLKPVPNIVLTLGGPAIDTLTLEDTPGLSLRLMLGPGPAIYLAHRELAGTQLVLCLTKHGGMGERVEGTFAGVARTPRQDVLDTIRVTDGFLSAALHPSHSKQDE